MDLEGEMLVNLVASKEGVNGPKLIVSRPCTSALLLLLAIVTGLFAHALYPCTVAPFIFFFALLFFARTCPWNLVPVGVGVLVMVSVPLLPLFHLGTSITVCAIVLSAIVAGGAVVDRIIFWKLISWCCDTFQRDRYRKSKIMKSFMGIRMVVAINFFPVLYSAVFAVVDILETFPISGIQFSNFGWGIVHSELRMLGAIGGMPLISYAICLTASVVVTWWCTNELQREGAIDFLRISMQAPYPYEATSPYTSSLRNVDRRHHPSGISDDNLRAAMDGEEIFGDIGRYLRAGMTPWAILAGILLSAGPILTTAFARPPVMDTVAAMAHRLPLVRVGCIPGHPNAKIIEEAVRAKVELLLTSEEGPSADVAQKLAAAGKMVVGTAHVADDGQRKFALVDKNGDVLLEHFKYSSMGGDRRGAGAHEIATGKAKFSTLGTGEETNASENSANSKDSEKRELPENLQPVENAEDENSNESNSQATEKDSVSTELANSSGTLEVKVAAAIASDYYSALTISEAGRNHVQLMIAPSGVGDRVSQAHLALLQMRSIENGFHILSCSKDGASGAFGPFGEVFAHAMPSSSLLLFDVPLHPQTKPWAFYRLYPRISRPLSWLCPILAFMLGLFGLAF